jgi:hypothetical protein
VHDRRRGDAFPHITHEVKPLASQTKADTPPIDAESPTGAAAYRSQARSDRPSASRVRARRRV